MKEEWVHIEATRHTFKFMGETFYYNTYEWVGSKYGIATITEDYRTQALPYLPWPVKVLGKVDFDRAYEIVRKDVGWHMWWILVTLWRKLKGRRYYHFKWRVVMTFDLWGLGYQPEGEVTSWKNIWRKRETKN